MVFAAYEFVQKRAERKRWQEGWKRGWKEGFQQGQKEERERIRRELLALVSNDDGSATVSREDIKRIIHPDRE